MIEVSPTHEQELHDFNCLLGKPQKKKKKRTKKFNSDDGRPRFDVAGLSFMVEDNVINKQEMFVTEVNWVVTCAVVGINCCLYCN